MVTLSTACGGKVFYAGTEEGGGGQGAGGAGPTTPSTTTEGPNTGTFVSTDVVSTDVSVSNTGTSTGTGGFGCDTGVEAPFDSPECTDCIDCSINGDCAESYFAYVDHPNAQPWSDCVFGDGSPMNPGCQDDACIQMCNDAYPGVYELYINVIECIFCNVCYFNCDGQSTCGF